MAGAGGWWLVGVGWWGRGVVVVVMVVVVVVDVAAAVVVVGVVAAAAAVLLLPLAFMFSLCLSVFLAVAFFAAAAAAVLFVVVASVSLALVSQLFLWLFSLAPLFLKRCHAILHFLLMPVLVVISVLRLVRDTASRSHRDPFGLTATKAGPRETFVRLRGGFNRGSSHANLRTFVRNRTWIFLTKRCAQCRTESPTS